MRILGVLVLLSIGIVVAYLATGVMKRAAEAVVWTVAGIAAVWILVVFGEGILVFLLAASKAAVDWLFAA